MFTVLTVMKRNCFDNDNKVILLLKKNKKKNIKKSITTENSKNRKVLQKMFDKYQYPNNLLFKNKLTKQKMLDVFGKKSPLTLTFGHSNC